MADKFTGSDGVMAPARKAAAVTTHDTDPLPGGTTKGLFVGGAGNIALRFADDSADVTLTGVVAGCVLPIRVTHVRATLTTATNIVALY